MLTFWTGVFRPRLFAFSTGVYTLKARAAAAGLSLSEYLLAEVVRVAERPPVAEVLARAGERHGGAPVESIVDAVRSGRDRT